LAAIIEASGGDLISPMSLKETGLLESENAEACFKRGVMFMENGQYSKAETCFHRTLVLAPDSPETMLNLGYALDKQGRAAEALECYESVLALAPQNAKARYNRATHLLRAGDLVNGFADYEARFSAMNAADSRTYPQPRWDGSPLNGRSILVYCEQGLGDAIQFVRYIPLLAQKGGRILLEAQQPLLSLCASLNGVEHVVLKSETPPQADFHVPLLSLPHLFGTTITTIPAEVPYLVPPADTVSYWRAKLGEPGDVFRIGLVWAGKPTPDPNRSCPPDCLAPLLTIDGPRFYSLQFGERDQLPLSKELAAHVIDLADDIGDFARTAALIANLDLVITIDTVIAHLAGALGKPVWVMLPFAAEWRWMTGRSDSPWYPTMRLFRQPKAADWPSVIGEIVQALHRYKFPRTNQAEAKSESFEPRFQRALVALEENTPDPAIRELCDLALQLPDDPAVWFNLGRAYVMTGQLAEAEHAYRQALIDNPDSPAIWFALGEIRLKQEAYPAAEFCLQKAHNLKPESVEILLSLGSALSAQRKTAESFDICQRILTIKPDSVEAAYNMGFIQLRRGDYRHGFANFEARLAIEKFNIDPRKYKQPRWDGSPLDGRSILIYGEQGMGDVIEFARYIPLVTERGGRVVLEVDPPLVPLFEAFPGIDRIVVQSEQPPFTDVYIQLLSLPYMFGTTLETVPNRVPYIIADQSKVKAWRQRLGNSPFLRVGLVWRGNPRNPRDKQRSCALSTFAPLAGLPDVHFYSLQVGAAAAEATAVPEGMHLIDMSTLLTDFTETAALLANLDLLIAVDTAVAHLAGAMGRLVWVVLPQGSDWRWLEGRDDSPWYPTMRVFEHEHESDWDGVIRRVRSALETWRAEKTDHGGLMGIEERYEQGARLKEAGDLEGAERCFRLIVEQQPELPDPQYSLGVMLQLQGRLPEAISHYRLATTIDPGFVKAHYNLAYAYLRCARYQEALESVRTVLHYDPAHADAHWLLGMLLLQSGDFTHGWREYEWRWKAAKFTCRMPELGRPLWDGSPLDGRTLLIHMEQGRGDMIQFIRYVPLAAAMGGKVIACATPELVALLATVEGISLVVDRDDPLPDFDVHIPVQSLPYRFATTLDTIPHMVPYLRPDPRKVAEWQRVFADEGRFRIGLVWQGAPDHRDDQNRSCPLGEFLTVSDVVDADFYSLQVGAGSEQLHGLPDRMTVKDATGQIRNFSDTAALIAHLDLVISVDTAVAHLAGALGKPVWTVLPFVTEWRWLLGRDDTPWYPTMRLFRQTSPGDWPGVFGRLRDELESLLDSSERLNQLGIIQLRAGAAGRADQAFSRAIAREPNNAESHCNRGVALDALHDFEAAIDCYRKALLCNPNFITALFNMGNAYVSLNRPEEARAFYQRAIELNPDFVAGHLCLGEIGKTLQDFTLARTSFERAAAIAPDCADAFQGIAEICQAEERFEDAIFNYRLALVLKPGSTVALNMMGTAYQSIERLDEAEGCYRQALTLNPDQPTSLNNLGVVLNAQGRLEEAVSVYRQLLAVDPEYADGHWNLSVALLALGDYAEGWQEFEWRFRKSAPVPSRTFPQPLWDGGDLAGRTILLHAEQGFGDTFQFARYAPLVAQRGGKVIIECQLPALKKVLLSLDGVCGVVAVGEPLPYFDCHLSLMSLPLVFGTTLEMMPYHVPYLAADPHDVEVWRQCLGGTTGRFKVGLVWYAKQSQVLNRKRSCPLTFFSPLWMVEGVEFYTLQIGVGTEQLDEFAASHEIIDLTGAINDFADTAALIANLDLVITIDTAVAHLAGALGARTWLILPYVAEWRWLCRREDSPWYPSMRLFRQPSQGDWPALMDTVAGALQGCVKGRDGQTNLPPAHPGLKVGLAWSGRQDNPLNCKRSCPFSALAQLFELEGITFVKLQMDAIDDSDPRMIDLTGRIRDFEDTAALMANLDLIISIDTSVAHLSAATGRPTWVLLSHVADWRWSADRNNTPSWYPGVRLFRQPDFEDWAAVIREVAEHLSGLSGAPLPKPPPKHPDSSIYPSDERCKLEQLLEIKLQEVRRNGASSDAHLDVGAVLALLGRNIEAIDVFRHVLELDPEHAIGHLNLAYLLLEIGNYSEGWEHLEWRLKRLPSNLLPPWPMLNKTNLGTHTAGSSVLVHCEQGYGDTILFSRFLPLLSEAGYRVIISCQPPMAALVASVPGVNMVIPYGDMLPVCDVQVLLLSLPWLFSVDQNLLPARIPYLVPEKIQVELWKSELEGKMSAA